MACRFEHKGYRGTTIRDISEASGLLLRQLIAHIDSKEVLLFAMARTGERRLSSACLRPDGRGAGAPPREKLKRSS